MASVVPWSSISHPLVADVLATEPRVAVFDCDGTLWHGDAGEDFFLWSIARGLAAPRRAKEALLRWDQYRLGWAGEEEIWRAVARIYQGTPVGLLEEAAEEFADEHVMPRVYPEMQSLMMRLLERGVEIWAVSASNQWVIEAACARLGIWRNRVLATAAEIDGDIVSGRVPFVPTDEGKVRILRAHGVDAADCVFGNTAHDFEMMTLGRSAFAINPTQELLQIARAWRWKIHRLSHR